jgi:PAS domain-containing protein
MQTLADKVLEVLHADSAGLSLLTKNENRFYWAAIAGAWRPHIGGGTPRDFGPCGDVLDHNIPMLFTHWERRYPYLSTAMPLADEGLLVPFYVHGKAVGTIWAIAHNNRRKFDAEDLRTARKYGSFRVGGVSSRGVHRGPQIGIAAREKAERELSELNDDLEEQVRVRTEELEERNKQLRRSGAYLAEAQKLSMTGSFGWNVSADEHFWSDETFRIFEYDVSTKITLQLILDRVHPQDVPFVRQVIALAADGMEYECRLLMPSGSVKHLHIVAHGTRDQDGRLEYIGAVQDVTKRRLSEEGTRRGQVGVRARGQGREPWSIDGVDRARSQPAAVGHHHQRQHLSADAGCQSSKRRRRARNRSAHDSRWQPCV